MGSADDLKLYLYRLKLPGETEAIDYSISPDLIREDGEQELFSSPISVCGNLERIDSEQWILSLDISTELGLRCSICNIGFLFPVVVRGICRLIHFDEVKSGIFDCRHLIRQELLLESDCFQECDKDGCPERKNIVQYLQDTKNNRGDNPFEHL
ncbi:hypothetical protein CP10139811_0523 [Chlamydia ibidis]|uniref:Uncharacterized protein n=2 Tax=Chlamydia ibidis TaxID=1405396 RepID=S7J3G7_9CHLA|nr:hypothetical protein [Chlamydia ibidis]EPP34733.1 hypothetical protein CP10139811_0523 [Chlamydia ibidis]EQM62395.1 hypothetical protein H359_0902 [Chlamydia ibidis 10-1398/6]